MVLILPSLSVLSDPGHGPGAQVCAHAAIQTCESNYDDNDFPASHTAICQIYDMHCSARAISLIMQWLPRRVQQAGGYPGQSKTTIGVIF